MCEPTAACISRKWTHSWFCTFGKSKCQTPNTTTATRKKLAVERNTTVSFSVHQEEELVSIASLRTIKPTWSKASIIAMNRMMDAPVYAWFGRNSQTFIPIRNPFVAGYLCSILTRRSFMVRLLLPSINFLHRDSTRAISSGRLRCLQKLRLDSAVLIVPRLSK